MSDNRCVMCGTIIPEGGMVCPNCLNKSIVIDKTVYEDPAPDEREEKRIRRMDMVDYIVWDWVMPLLVGGFILYLMFGRW